MSGRRTGRNTSKALVSNFKVGRGVVRAGPGIVQLLVGKREDAASTGRTAGVEQRPDVRAAAEVAEVALDAASQLHPAVASLLDEDDATATAAADVDALHVAELGDYRRRFCIAARTRCQRLISQSDLISHTYIHQEIGSIET